MGQELIRRQIGNTILVVNSSLVGGTTGVGQVSERWLKPRFFVFILGGVLAQILAISVIMIFFNVGLRDMRNSGEASLIHDIFFCNAFLILLNLIPYRANVLGLRVPNDGLRLWKLPFMKQNEIQEILSTGKIMEAFELYEAKKYREAEQAHRECADIYPTILMPKVNISATLIKQLKLNEAIALLESQIGSYKKDPYENFLYENLAWAYFLKKGEEALRMANYYSAKAIELSPKQPNIRCTRGCILVEKGAVSEGIKLLRKIAKLSQPFNEWFNCPSAFIGLAHGYYRKGSQKKALQYVNKLEASYLQLDLDYQALFEHVVEKTDNFGRLMRYECVARRNKGLLPQTEELS